jgi:ubiquinone/menaquinone biosynthesis C-methylase UbiE
MLLALFSYGIPFSTDYKAFIGSIPLYLSALIVYVSAVPSYYIPASLYFKEVQRKVTNKFVLRTAFIFWGLSMFLDVIFVVLAAGINIFAYPFNWIYLGVSPVMIMSVYLAGIRRSGGKMRMGKMADIDELMYSCGLEILHPGGIEKTDEMARMCKIGKGKKVLDIGSGKGVTACYLAQKYGCEVVGVDLSKRMVEYAKEMAKRRGLDDRASFRRADAHNLPFEDESFDIVLAECTTVLLDKNKAFSEFLRVLKPGGYIGDLEMIWKKPPPKELVDKVYEVWEGFKTMTLNEWRKFFERMGMIDVKTVNFSEEIPDMEKAMKKELGLKGMIKMGFKLLLRSDLRKAMYEYRKIFNEYGDYIGYGYVVGRKK